MAVPGLLFWLALGAFVLFLLFAPLLDNIFLGPVTLNNFAYSLAVTAAGDPLLSGLLVLGFALGD